MMGTAPVTDTKSIEQVQSLLAIIADPKAAKAALKQIADAQEAADAKLMAANAAASGLDQREADVTAREAKAKENEDALAKVMERQRVYVATTTADLETRIAAVTAREIAVSTVDNATADRERAVSNREAAIEDKEKNLQDAFDKAAAMQREYDGKLAAIRSLAGA